MSLKYEPASEPLHISVNPRDLIALALDVDGVEGFREEPGLGFRIQGLGFRVEGLGFRV